MFCVVGLWYENTKLARVGLALPSFSLRLLDHLHWSACLAQLMAPRSSHITNRAWHIHHRTWSSTHGAWSMPSSLLLVLPSHSLAACTLTAHCRASTDVRPLARHAAQPGLDAHERSEVQKECEVPFPLSTPFPPPSFAIPSLLPHAPTVTPLPLPSPCSPPSQPSLLLALPLHLSAPCQATALHRAQLTRARGVGRHLIADNGGNGFRKWRVQLCMLGIAGPTSESRQSSCC